MSTTSLGDNQGASVQANNDQAGIEATVKTTFNQVRVWLIENTFIAAIILLAIITWLIALFMKNASARRSEDQIEGSIDSVASIEAMDSTDLRQQAFSKTLESIDLNLDDDLKDSDKKS